jgi:hypothetical protein
MTPAYRYLLKTCRLTHLYLTLFGLALILFFAVTGFMLNHEDWFVSAEPRTRTAEATLPPAYAEPVDKFEVTEGLRRAFGIGRLVNSFRTDDKTVEVEFVHPGGRAVAEVQRATGQTVVKFETRGVAGLITDLHKGKSAGPAWGLVIDGVCVLLLAVSATGLVLWWSLKARGQFDMAALVFGAGVAAAVYYWLVP